ncbi:MAG: DUF932 domain-containing protein [Vicinamibacterales bacterium]|nr:DUF932 domain-containing protein [Vicinamibacterales bacterium]
MDGLMLHRGAELIGRQNLPELVTPDPTETHVPIPHHRLVESVLESLAYRKIEVTRDQYAVSPDGMNMFGFLQVNIEHEGVQLALGLRNSHSKQFSLGIVAGYRVFVCDNLAFHGAFAAITKRKHTKHLERELIEVVSVGVDRIQRHFDKVRSDIDAWRGFELPDGRAKEVIYDAFIGRGIDAPQHLGKRVHQLYFAGVEPAFFPRNMWSLSNAFTSAFKELDPIPQMKAAESLQPFLAQFN